MTDWTRTIALAAFVIIVAALIWASNMIELRSNISSNQNTPPETKNLVPIYPCLENGKCP